LCNTDKIPKTLLLSWQLFMEIYLTWWGLCIFLACFNKLHTFTLVILFSVDFIVGVWWSCYDCRPCLASCCRTRRTRMNICLLLKKAVSAGQFHLFWLFVFNKKVFFHLIFILVSIFQFNWFLLLSLLIIHYFSSDVVAFLFVGFWNRT
jgi:hypothetical protein